MLRRMLALLSTLPRLPAGPTDEVELPDAKPAASKKPKSDTKPAGSQSAKPKAGAPEPGNGLAQLNKSVAVALAVLTALLAFLGFADGGIARVLRNRPGLFSLGGGLIMVSIVANAAASLIPTMSASSAAVRAKAAVVVGTALLVATSIATAVWGAVDARWADEDKLVLAVAGLPFLVALGLAWHALRASVGEREISGSRLFVAGTVPLVGAVGGLAYLVLGTFDYLVLVATAATTVVGLACVATAVMGSVPKGDLTLLNWARFGMAIGSVVLFLFGAGLIARAAVDFEASKERPRLTATLATEGTELRIEGRVEARGLRVGEHLHLQLLGVSSSADLGAYGTGRTFGRPGGITTDSIGTIRVGPDVDGAIDRAYAIPVTPGIYEAIYVQAEIVPEPLWPPEASTVAALPEAPAAAAAATGVGRGAARGPGICRERATASCVELRLPMRNLRPRLTAGLGDLTVASRALAVTVEAPAMAPDEAVDLTLYTQAAPRAAFVPAYRVTVTPGADGLAKAADISIPLPDRYHAVCLVAATQLGTGLPREGGLEACPPADNVTAVLSTTIHRPIDSGAPQLSAAVKTSDDGRAVTVSVAEDDVGAEEVVAVAVVAKPVGSTGFAPIYQALLAPDVAGSVAATDISVDLADDVCEICVLAARGADLTELTAAADPCSAAGPGIAVTRIATPAQAGE